MSFREALANRDSREVHSQKPRSFLPIVGEHGRWQADLMFLPKEYAHFNSGYNGLANFINIANRFAISAPIKTKDAPELARVCERFVKAAHEHGQDVHVLETDGGGEFKAEFDGVLAKNQIRHVVADAEDHRSQGIVERFNQSIRRWIEVFLTDKSKNRWIDVLPEIVEFYNSRKHATTHMAPEDTTFLAEVEIKCRRMEEAAKAMAHVETFNVGTRVRTLRNRGKFAKGRLHWSDQVFTIEEIGGAGARFRLKGGLKWWKYSDLLRVGADSKDIEPKDPEVHVAKAHEKHLANVGRTNLTRGRKEAEALIATAKALPEGRPTRERRAPVRFDDEPDRPQLAKAPPRKAPAPGYKAPP